MTRIYVYDYVAEALESYADERDISVAEVVAELVDEFIEELDM